ncbi:MAG: sterol desaturase/sphingolipid hydroxylase (fatty acid hydroxylase superfamily) [Myxococcota bacterium]|jgi:sterol desaturase/sphingolipid hydroxylase (fatty acid hydroxylase superfamily)
MIGIPLGLLYANASEWLIHKYLLHGLGRDKESFWAFHWHDHHKAVRRNGHHDPNYERSPFGLHSQGKEAFALAAVTAAHLPLAPVAPFFTATVVYSAVNYYRKHKRSHLDPEWARENLPWHYDHHMGPNQDSNWGVTRPWFDQLMGTREPYVGTEREARDIQRAKHRKSRKKGKRAAVAASTRMPEHAPAV